MHQMLGASQRPVMSSTQDFVLWLPMKIETFLTIFKATFISHDG